ncbi:dirigent protein 22-like [Solanum tuberosum]|uniref:Dirigent protein n=1 Tax=Solanum tuberosum TaxID=4113 RepID=M1C3B1_SOLTU|nr:PREDICTED: dirigent protein 22-like [Solanum tuberosum]
MKKFLFMICLLIAIANLSSTLGLNLSPKGVEKWFKNLSHAKEKMTKFHFYFHDIVSGKNPSAIQIAQANVTSLSPTSFGLVRMMDNPMTIGPNINSEVIGRAQGMYGFTSFEDRELLMTFNFVFTKGKHNGSTLSILGHNRASREYRELPVVGGSGVFRLARGTVTAKTYWYNATTRDVIIECHVIILHY